MKLSASIPKVFARTEDDVELMMSVPVASTALSAAEHTVVSLEPEVRVISETGFKSWTSLDLIITVNAIKLHLYDQFATTEADFKSHGIVRFAVSTGSLRFKMLSDGAAEAQLVLKSFTMNNTRPGNSKFREIIPAAEHDRNQFMVLYTMIGGANGSALAILTIDSPQIIFAMDPVFALVEFFASPFPTNSSNETQLGIVQVETSEPSSQSILDFRVDLHDVLVTVLEDDTNPATQSIRLTIAQVLLSRQVSYLVLDRPLTFTVCSGNNGFDCQPSWHVFDEYGQGIR